MLGGRVAVYKVSSNCKSDYQSEMAIIKNAKNGGWRLAIGCLLQLVFTSLYLAHSSVSFNQTPAPTPNSQCHTAHKSQQTAS
jgi:hypothetical protein